MSFLDQENESILTKNISAKRALYLLIKQLKLLADLHQSFNRWFTQVLRATIYATQFIHISDNYNWK